jgi:hypothetical protein
MRTRSENTNGKVRSNNFYSNLNMNNYSNVVQRQNTAVPTNFCIFCQLHSKVSSRSTPNAGPLASGNYRGGEGGG